MDAKRILVIEDDSDIAGTIRDCLEEKGYVVSVAPDGKRGIESAEKEKPDLILLDIGLPDMNGYEVCEKIRALPELRHTPLIMLTARTQEKDEVSGFNVGADDFISKPFKPARLLARIQTAIGRNVRELDANALTHLPGNIEIAQAIQALIAQKGAFSVLYSDLNNFKAFNDRYGFTRGDEAIQMTADILIREFKSFDSSSFVGHVGGDDFVGIVKTHEVKTLCERIINQFDKSIVQLYDEPDRRSGKIVSVDRKGVKTEFPIMGLAIAVVTNRQKAFKHPGEVALIAGDLKKWVKSDHRSAYVIDRRT